MLGPLQNLRVNSCEGHIISVDEKVTYKETKMLEQNTTTSMIMRLFHVRTKPGCVDQLIKNFESTSADVVRHEPGNKGYYFGRGVAKDDEIVVFASFWQDLDAIKARFGEDWQVSFLPEGYEDLIEECWIEHIDVGDGWFVNPDKIN